MSNSFWLVETATLKNKVKLKGQPLTNNSLEIFNRESPSSRKSERTDNSKEILLNHLRTSSFKLVTPGRNPIEIYPKSQDLHTHFPWNMFCLAFSTTEP